LTGDEMCFSCLQGQEPATDQEVANKI